MEIEPINNSSIIEKNREFGIITEYEVIHQCIADVWDTLTLDDINNRRPLHCAICGQDIVRFIG